MSVEKKEPEIRFKGFSWEWDAALLKDVSTYSNGGSFENDVKAEGKYELVTLKSVDMNGNLVSSGRYIDVEAPTLPKDTLVMILSEQSPGLLGMTARIPVSDKYVLNQRVAEIRPLKNIESYFLSMAVNRNQRYFSERGAGTKVQNISKPNVENYEFLIPKKEEQAIIGNYFQKLDNLIKQHQQKHAMLSNIKKAMLEKMFPKQGETIPEIRFKGFSGEWEEKKLGEIGETFTGLAGKTKHDFGHGQARFVTYMNVFANAISNESLVEPVEIDESQNEVVKGDVFFTTSSETPEEVGMSSIWMGEAKNVYLNSFCFGYRPKQKIDSVYLAYMLRASSFRKQVIFLAQGVSRYNISKTKVMDIKTYMPSLLEQEKIGSYFQKLDALINQHQQQITKLNNIKQACLSKMFV
ncbi:restriction endonuclease subunit S [Vibrio furnissii]|uniref:restriction endonuclease subunit S n=1 Tax=Vibrio furnissii TaxID=29494 RepID=UPI003747BA23